MIHVKDAVLLLKHVNEFPSFNVHVCCHVVLCGILHAMFWMASQSNWCLIPVRSRLLPVWSR